MNTNEKIATWLGMKKLTKNAYERKIDGGYKYYFLDFLHDRNQQKWIIDEIIKRGYGIEMTYLLKVKEWSVNIYDIYLHDVAAFCDKDLDLAFLEAIEQLIDKENER